MRVDWLSWSNPVSIWWGFLLIVSSVNIILWFLLKSGLRRRTLRLEFIVAHSVTSNGQNLAALDR
jgi:hypothetical protein